MSQLPSRASFAEHVGTVFRVRAGAERREEVALIDVTLLRGGRTGPTGREQFSILFRGGKGEHLRQGTYRMEHAALGALDLFIVPIGPDESGMRYEAVFT